MDIHFTPNDAQRHLDACFDPHVPPNVEARRLAVSISRQTHYNYTQQARFFEWLAAERRRIAHAELPGVMAALARKAKADQQEERAKRGSVPRSRSRVAWRRTRCRSSLRIWAAPQGRRAAGG